MAVTEADRIMAEGVGVKMLDGTQLRLRFSLRALKRLEDAFGTLEVAVDRLNQLQLQRREGMTMPVLDDLDVFLSAGLDLPRGTALDHVDELLHTAIPLCLEAWVEAFPGAVAGEAEAPRTEPSPGG